MNKRDLLRSLEIVETRKAPASSRDVLPASLLRAFWRAWYAERDELGEWTDPKEFGRRFERLAVERFLSIPATFSVERAPGATVTLERVSLERNWPAAHFVIRWANGAEQKTVVSGGPLIPAEWMRSAFANVIPIFP